MTWTMETETRETRRRSGQSRSPLSLPSHIPSSAMRPCQRDPTPASRRQNCPSSTQTVACRPQTAGMRNLNHLVDMYMGKDTRCPFVPLCHPTRPCSNQSPGLVRCTNARLLLRHIGTLFPADAPCMAILRLTASQGNIQRQERKCAATDGPCSL